MRSLMFIPAKDKMLKKISTFSADSYILDLEDSVEQDMKSDALNNVYTFLKENETIKPIIVRVNKESYRIEIEKLDKYDVSFMLPKFERTDDYLEIGKYCSRHRFYALIETPYGLVNIENIVSNKDISALAFGAEDFTASMCMDNEIDFLQYQKARLVTYSKAYKKKVYDTPSFKLDDYEKFKIEVENSKSLGFDGKMVISPKHVDYINKAFSLTNIDFLRRIVELYEKENQAVLVIDGKVYEKMHIKHIKNILKECEVK